MLTQISLAVGLIATSVGVTTNVGRTLILSLAYRLTQLAAVAIPFYCVVLAFVPSTRSSFDNFSSMIPAMASIEATNDFGSWILRGFATAGISLAMLVALQLLKSQSLLCGFLGSIRSEFQEAYAVMEDQLDSPAGSKEIGNIRSAMNQMKHLLGRRR